MHYNNGILNGTNQAVKMALDTAGNIYVTGFSQNTNTNLGYVTIKYAPNGKQVWASRYDSTNYPAATPSCLVLGASNNAVVTGSAVTVNYDANGNQLWTAPYGGSALAVDRNGNIAVTGFDTLFSTVKLNSSGTNLWQETNPSTCGAAMAQSIVADTNGNFYVAGNYPGFCESGVIDYALLLIKYGSNGNQVWTAAYPYGGYTWQVEGAFVGASNNLYLVANITSGFSAEYVGFEYNANGGLVWVTLASNNSYSRAHAMAIDTNQCVVMTGQVPTSFNPGPVFSCGTIELGTNGSAMWTSLYPMSATATGVANAVAVDQANNVYVTGYSPGTNSINDIVTIKYDNNGNQIWLQRYSSPGNGNAAGNAIAVDNNGNVYVTGYDTTAAGGTEIVTIKYSPVTLQRRSDGTVILQAQGAPGESFDIEASSDLLNWLDLGSVLADTNGLMQFDDTNAGKFPARFYTTSPQ